ncbi:hypothetical protein AAHE18_03G233400 [Arachis hypogaea]
MWRGYARGHIAIAVDNKEPSKLALSWALVNRNFIDVNPVILIHVVRTPPTGIHQVQSDDEVMEMLIPHRSYCTERNVQYEVVIVRDENVAAGILEYVSSQVDIRILILGSSTKRSRKSALSRIFKKKKNREDDVEIETTVLKWLPPHFRVYVIYKGNMTSHWDNLVAQRYKYRRLSPLNRNPRVRINNYPEVELDYEENNNPPLSFGNESPDNNDSISFYENLHSRQTVGGSSSSNNLNSDDDEPLFLQDKMEDEVIRQEVVGPKKAIMEFYHEAQISKQKLMNNELKGCNMKQEQIMKEAESEKVLKSEAAIEEVERLAEQAVGENRMSEAQAKAVMEADSMQKLFDALHQSQFFLKYQSLFNIFIFLFLSYMYYSLSK